MLRRVCPVLVATVMLAVPAWAQEDLERGKSAAQMFSSDCAVCHRTPQGLAKGYAASSLVGFLRQHYTSSPSTAATLTTYLLSVPGGTAPGRRPAVATPGEPEPARPTRAPTTETRAPDQSGPATRRRPTAEEGVTPTQEPRLKRQPTADINSEPERRSTTRKKRDTPEQPAAAQSSPAPEGTTQRPVRRQTASPSESIERRSPERRRPPSRQQPTASQSTTPATITGSSPPALPAPLPAAPPVGEAQPASAPRAQSSETQTSERSSQPVFSSPAP